MEMLNSHPTFHFCKNFPIFPFFCSIITLQQDFYCTKTYVSCCSYFSRRSLLYSVFRLPLRSLSVRLMSLATPLNIVASPPGLLHSKSRMFHTDFFVQILTSVGIGMVHHQLYLRQRQFIKVFSFDTILRINSYPTLLPAIWSVTLKLQ